MDVRPKLTEIRGKSGESAIIGTGQAQVRGPFGLSQQACGRLRTQTSVEGRVGAAQVRAENTAEAN